MGDVIDFDSFKKKIEEYDREEDEMFVVDTALFIAREVVDYLSEQGYDLQANSDTLYSLVLLVETLKSIMHTSVGDEYPLTEVAQALYPIENLEELFSEFFD